MSQRAAFLDSVSHLILRTRDVHQIASRVLDLVVPKLADCAIVWALDRDGALEYLASTHVEARLREPVVEFARAAAEGGLPRLSSDVLRQRQSLLLPDASPSALERAGFDAAQRRRFGQLRVRTAIAVPLAMAGKTFGAMTLFAEGRRYRSEDLGLAEEIGERVAAALENARLYEIARDAIRARDDFMMLASHELRTPLAALQLLSDELLRRDPAGEYAEKATTTEAIARQVRRLNVLVEHVVDALGIRAEGIALSLESCDLAEDREGSRPQHRRTSPARGVRDDRPRGLTGPRALGSRARGAAGRRPAGQRHQVRCGQADRGDAGP